MKVNMSPDAVTRRLEITNALWLEAVNLMESKGIDAETAMQIVNDQYDRGELGIAENHIKK